MKTLSCLMLAVLSFPATANAHFLWLLASPRDGKVYVYFGEAAEPDDPDLLSRVEKAQVWSVDYRGEPAPLSLKKGEESLEAALSDRAKQSPVILNHTYGLFSRGGKASLLNYYAKAYPFALPGTWREISDAKRLPLEITPSRDGDSTVLHVTWHGEASSGCEIVAVGPGIEDKLTGATDEAGNYQCRLPMSGTYSIRARLIENKAGKHNGEAYSAIRHYSTLTLQNVPSDLKSAKHSLPELPKGITSFGGAIVGDSFYAYGGNYGSSHTYHNKGQSNDLWTLNLLKPKKWKRLANGPRLQGLAMVAHGGKLYRVGGFTAMNEEDADQDLRSQTSVARFDPESRNWEDLPPLPEPRSSHDAAVLGDMLYVAGGWNMPGTGKDNVWHKTAWALNLSEERLKWKAVATPPFQRRALSLGALNGKLYCIGGMQIQGGPTTRVDVYDPASNCWLEAPSLMGSSMDGFGSSAFACAGSLYVSTISGSLQRLSNDGNSWQLAGQLDHPRFFHRMAPWKNALLVSVGGGNMSVGKVTEVDVITVAK